MYNIIVVSNQKCNDDRLSELWQKKIECHRSSMKQLTIEARKLNVDPLEKPLLVELVVREFRSCAFDELDL
jgi:hypothetical protein